MLYDIAIIGAGPAGAASAILLGRAGHRVLLIDRCRFPRDKICGECLSPAAVPLLQSLGVAEGLPAIGAFPYRGFKLVAPDGGSCVLAYHHPPSGSQGYCVSRRSLDHLILRQAKRVGNVQVREECRVERVQRDVGGGWRLNGIDSQGQTQFKARAIVVANGRSSFLSSGRRPHRRSSLQRLCLLADFAGVDGVEPTMECGVAGRGLQYLIGPKGKDKALFCVVITLEKERMPRLAQQELLHYWLRQIPGLAKRFARAEITSFVRGLSLESYAPSSLVEDGLMRVGDATGFMDPITGEGMYRAFKSAALCAQTLGHCLSEKNLTRAALLPYERQMRREFFWMCRFVQISVWALHRPWLVNRLVACLNRHASLRARLAGIQGGFLPAKDFFSVDLLAKLVFTKKGTSHV